MGLFPEHRPGSIFDYGMKCLFFYNGRKKLLSTLLSTA